MPKKQKQQLYTLDDLERELRVEFQCARRKLDMIERFRTSTHTSNITKQFVGALLHDNEVLARQLVRQ